MKVLIAGIPENTRNYERALSFCRVSSETDLYPAELSSYDKLLLPGGGDLHPSWFGQKDQASVSADKALDRVQFALLHAFFLAGKPILGICRGMQLINVYFGGDLIQTFLLPTGTDFLRKTRSILRTVRPVLCCIGSAAAPAWSTAPIIRAADASAADLWSRRLPRTRFRKRWSTAKDLFYVFNGTRNALPSLPAA